jgi:hypothetical protein
MFVKKKNVKKVFFSSEYFYYFFPECDTKKLLFVFLFYLNMYYRIGLTIIHKFFTDYYHCSESLIKHKTLYYINFNFNIL